MFPLGTKNVGCLCTMFEVKTSNLRDMTLEMNFLLVSICGCVWFHHVCPLQKLFLPNDARHYLLIRNCTLSININA